MKSTKEDYLEIISSSGYRRISDSIETLWGEKDLEVYFQKLLRDDRGDRQGFPEPVFSAILNLSLIHSHEFSFETPTDVWSSVPEHKTLRTKEWTSNQVADTPPRRFLISPLTLSILMGSAWLLWKVFFNH